MLKEEGEGLSIKNESQTKGDTVGIWGGGQGDACSNDVMLIMLFCLDIFPPLIGIRLAPPPPLTHPTSQERKKEGDTLGLKKA